MAPEVGLELAIDDLGREQEGPLAEGVQLVGGVRVGVRPGRRVHDDEFVGAAHEVLRDGLGRRTADHLADEVLLLGDVLEADRRQDRDARLEHFLDVLVAPGVSGAGRVVVRQPVDQAHARPALEQRVHVEDRDAVDLAQGNPLEVVDHARRVGRHVGLKGRHDDVLSPLVPPPPLVEEPERLAHPWRVPEEHLQPADARGAFPRFDVPKQRLGVPPPGRRAFSGRHRGALYVVCRPAAPLPSPSTRARS